MEEFISSLQIPVYLYHSVFIWTMLALTMFYFIYLQTANNSNILQAKSSSAPAFLLTAAVIVFLGFRPVSGAFFADMAMYAHMYNNVIGEVAELSADVNTHSEWFWDLCMDIFKYFGMPDIIFFAFCELVYIGLMYWACKRLMPNNVWPAMLFCLCAFSFYGYAVNGIRNGFGCSMALLAFTYMLGNKRDKIFAAIVLFLSFGVHRSLILPTACSIVSAFIIKKPATAIKIWFASIFVSLLFGGAVSELFMSLGFDDRYNDYLRAGVDDETMEQFSYSGFRWDFLLYSAVPVWLSWYVSVKRNIQNRMFNFLSCTYIFANAFWVMVIRSSFSNRFAYLSWFMYPLVIAYPLLQMKIWQRQHLKVATALILYELFTFGMYLIGK